MATKHQGTAGEIRALDLFIKFMRAHDALAAHLRRLIAGFALQPSQFGILETLYHLGPMQQHELAAKLLQTPGNITRILDKLEQEALVERRSEPGDRRCHRIALTKQGEKRIAAIFPQFAAAMQDIFKGLTADEQKQLADLLRKAGKSFVYSLNNE
jgi:MarR family 2-MHQ and catechol resistance regulon transcriptional repressor